MTYGEGKMLACCQRNVQYFRINIGRYDGISLPALVVLVTLTFDLESGAHYCSLVGQYLPTNFGLSRTFRSRLIGQHLSDASRDLATLTIDFEGHGACR